jgi:secreted trypsin-like serine protease
MGEWDASNNNEPIPFYEYNVARIFVHPSYSSSSLINSIAILRLSSNVPLGQVPTITTGCLTRTQISGMRCWVAGWGSASFNTVPTNPIQSHVDVPLVDQTTCQTKLRTTKLGSAFVLDSNSFMCAGGEAGKGKVIKVVSI